MVREDIRRLIDEVREIAESDRNKELQRKWAPQGDFARDHWRGEPRKDGSPAFTIAPENAMWSEILDFDLRDYYTKPEVYLEQQLQLRIYQFKEFDDDTCVSKVIPIWLGVVLEPSLFGVESVYFPHTDPWIAKKPVIKEKSDLDKMDYPDFYRSGIMPTAHRMYEGIRELLPDDFAVTFPEWGRSPFAVAMHIRAMDNILADMLEDPPFAKRLIGFVTEARRRWTGERASFLDQRVEQGNLYNDEVNCPTLSPRLYEEFVLPFEQELSSFHSGIAYWHSCGDTTKLVGLINQIPNLGMFHVGPWTDIEQAVETFAPNTSLEICLDPVMDVQMADEKRMEEKLRTIKETCQDRIAYTVRADGLQLLYTLEEDIAKIKDWSQIARKLFG